MIRGVIQVPFEQSYWVREPLFCVGHYPGSLEQQERNEKLKGLLDCQIKRMINLIPSEETGAGGRAFDLYEPVLQEMAAERGLEVECLQLGFPDGSVPERSVVRTILDRIDASIAAGEAVYLHCWGGHGRTSTIVGCYLIRHGASPQEAIDQIVAWRKPLPRNYFPYEGRQEAFVHTWQMGE